MSRGRVTTDGRIRWCSVPYIACALFCACSSPPAPATRPPAAGADRAASVESVIATDAWTFGAARGRMITTPSYRLFTTVAPGVFMDRLPGFAESALARYRTAFGPLPVPGRPLDTYVMANRPQWQRLAAVLLAGKGTPYEQITRGGVTVDGRSILYDVGAHDTFALVAHEGWHQYTQSTFREALPVWLEEGIATVMEGFRWRADDAARPEFLPWCNLERFDQLRALGAKGGMLALPDLLSSSPALAMDKGSSAALAYYAQVWALSLFLMEGEDGRHRPALQRLLDDASRGVPSLHVRQSAARGVDGPTGEAGRGRDIFVAYFGGDLPRIDGAFQTFCRTIVQPTNRDALVDGHRPRGV